MTSEQLRRVLLLHGVHVDFQPRVSTESNKIVGFEALARIPHGYSKGDTTTVGVIPPGEYLPWLTTETRILLFTKVLAAVTTVMDNHPDWFFLREDLVTVGVNIEPLLLSSASVRNRLLALPPKYRRHLELELLEHRIDDVVTLTTRMRDLNKQGFRFVVDDFGTEGAGLRALMFKSSGVGKIKFDGVLLPGRSNHSTGQDSLLFFKDLAELVVKTGLRVVAEQIERKDQFDQVAPHVHEIQGFYFGAPAPFHVWADRARKQIEPVCQTAFRRGK